MWSLLVLDLRSVICPLTMRLKSILILLYDLSLFDWKYFFWCLLKFVMLSPRMTISLLLFLTNSLYVCLPGTTFFLSGISWFSGLLFTTVVGLLVFIKLAWLFAIVLGLLQLSKLLQLCKFKPAYLTYESLVLFLVGLVFGLLSYCSTFTVSFTSSSTVNYSDLSGESIFYFYWLNWLIVLTRLLFFDFWKKKSSQVSAFTFW